VNGLREVDFGVFDASNFQKPFGPHSAAIYSEGAAVLATASLASSPGPVCVEFILLTASDGERRQRRRVVAVWAPKQVRCCPDATGAVGEDDGGLSARLTGVTVVVEEEGGTECGPAGAEIPEVLVAAEQGGRSVDGAPSKWHPGERVVTARGGISREAIAHAPSPPDVHALPGGLVSWLPVELQLRSRGSLEMAVACRRAAGDYVRLAARYAHGELECSTRDILT